MVSNDMSTDTIIAHKFFYSCACKSESRVVLLFRKGLRVIKDLEV